MNLDRHCRELVAVAARSVDPRGGFGWARADGTPDPGRPLQLWVNARMTHVFGLAHLLGFEGADVLVDRGVDALRGPLHDDDHGGWWPEVEIGGPAAVGGASRVTRPVVDEKRGYDHAFVLLAACTAVQAGRPGAAELLDEAVEVMESRFWDEQAGAVVDVWDGAWTRLDPYRGANANMHAVEAFLAVADVVEGNGSRDGADAGALAAASAADEWRDRALLIAERLIDQEARAAGWRVPEHYGPDWTPRPDYGVDHPADAFRPYGATIGHGLEWSRLLLHLDAALLGAAMADVAVLETVVDDGNVFAVDHPEAPRREWLVPAARSLFDVAVDDGWSVDGETGFVYTVDRDGVPVVRQRMHWVVAEAIAAAAALYQESGEPRYERWYREWWQYAEDRFVDRAAGGSWRHELDPQHQPSQTVWSGRPDVYHALQATLLPRLPLAPSLAAALARTGRRR